jgi:hypothetical protein
VAFQSPPAPFAARASQVDLSGHPLAGQFRVVTLHDLAGELVAGRVAESVVSALQLEVGIGDAGAAFSTDTRRS